MSSLPVEWHLHPIVDLPREFLQAVQTCTGEGGRYLAQLLWQRGMRDLKQMPGFLKPAQYQPTSPFAFGEEMEWAIARLIQAHHQGEKVAIWGDFDADGITATAVLWDGLGQFFTPGSQLIYHIPNRLIESHGLAIAGLDTLADWGCQLIVTCDTGSTNLTELDYARTLGMEVIVTDHHTLPVDRPPVTAIINPRSLDAAHPLATLSGVAVAYKLVEGLYERLPGVPTQPLDRLLDLVAIGLIADLVELTGDCRYLAQLGIEQLQKNQSRVPPPRPGIAKVLEFCKRSGDRPTDISFGIGPRVNAISRIHGDARFGVELLTSQDGDRSAQLAEATELANTRRKALQKDVVLQVKARLAQLDLSTTSVIVLHDPQWSVGVLGLVAGQIAQEYGRPTILLTSHPPADGSEPLARGSARSVQAIDLYQLVSHQQHLLHSFGGHPYAAGLSLPLGKLPVFTAAINQQLRQQQSATAASVVIQADLTVPVAELGKDLFRELKWLEPCGMGNPPPRLLIRNAWFRNAKNRNIVDRKGNKLRYIKTEFELWDESVSTGFPGLWWEHYQDELPAGRSDAIVELDFNAYHKRYEVRLLAVRPTDTPLAIASPSDTPWIVDWRPSSPAAPSPLPPAAAVLTLSTCPSSWNDLQRWFRLAIQTEKALAIAFPAPDPISPIDTWHTLIGIAKYLSRTGITASSSQLLERLAIGDRTLGVGLSSLQSLGFEVEATSAGYGIVWRSPDEGSFPHPNDYQNAMQTFCHAVQEEYFRRHYFYTLPLATIQAMASRVKGEGCAFGSPSPIKGDGAGG